MPLTLETAVDADFAELIDCSWRAHEEPFLPFFRLYAPIHGTGPKARAEAIQEDIEKLREWHQSDPHSYWQKVVDTDTGRIAGGALWRIYEQNPFAQHEDLEATWYPPGDKREYVNAALTEADAPRMEMGQRPHISGLASDPKVLNILFTAPEYRKRGAGSLVMDWGSKKAEEMGVEMWLDATAMGKPLYEKYGFVVVRYSDIAPKRENPSKDWQEMERLCQPFRSYHMWRPKGGEYVEGMTVKPWEQGLVDAK